MSKTFQETFVERSNGSEASGEENPCVEWPENYGNRILIFFDEYIVTVDPVFNKKNDRVVPFDNNISEHRRVSRFRHPASIIMLEVVATYGENQ